MFELPPILQGTEQDQLRLMRDYLARMAQSLDSNINRAVDERIVVNEQAKAEKAGGSAATERETQLKSLIIKTANTIQHNLDIVTQQLHEDYLALSDFGTYQETINTTIESTARNIVESYDFESALAALDSRLDSSDAYMTAIRGEIRRGLITDPESGETAMGIAISEELSFTGVEHIEAGLTYYELTPGQTLGLYTATGWQFWINGSKRGWFDSRDGMLHVANLAVETSLMIGGGWLITTSGGFGIRYMGG